jgi:hypothetical protein
MCCVVPPVSQLRFFPMRLVIRPVFGTDSHLVLLIPRFLRHLSALPVLAHPLPGSGAIGRWVLLIPLPALRIPLCAMQLVVAPIVRTFFRYVLLVICLVVQPKLFPLCCERCPRWLLRFRFLGLSAATGTACHRVRCCAYSSKSATAALETRVFETCLLFPQYLKTSGSLFVLKAVSKSKFHKLELLLIFETATHILGASSYLFLIQIMGLVTIISYIIRYTVIFSR